MERIFIEGRGYEFIDAPEKFEWILEDTLGIDSARYFRSALDEIKYDADACPGECERIYQIQEHYERVIQDAIEDLYEIEPHKSDEGKMNRLFARLNDGLYAKRYITKDEVQDRLDKGIKMLMKSVRDGEIGRVDASAFKRAVDVLKGALR